MERIARRRLQRREKALLQVQEGTLTERKTMKKQHLGSKNNVKSVKITYSLPLLPP